MRPVAGNITGSKVLSEYGKQLNLEEITKTRNAYEKEGKELLRNRKPLPSKYSEKDDAIKTLEDKANDLMFVIEGLEIEKWKLEAEITIAVSKDTTLTSDVKRKAKEKELLIQSRDLAKVIGDLRIFRNELRAVQAEIRLEERAYEWITKEV